MKSFKMALPKTLDGAVRVLGSDFDKTPIMAGGTDLLAAVKEHITEPDMVVNLKGIKGISDVVETEAGLEIGALVKLDELAGNKLVANGWAALVDSVASTATPQIRNVGTIGGNLCQRPRCWYFRHEDYNCTKKGGHECYAFEGENTYHAIFGTGMCQIVHPSNLAGPLIAYDAKIEIQGPKGSRTVALEDFFVTPEQNIKRENILKPNEILTKILIPKASASKNSSYYETREKESFDWALCGASFNLKMDGKTITQARVVFNAVAPVPIRRKDLEKMLVGQKASDSLFEKVSKAAVKTATPLHQNEYKIDLLKTVIVRGLKKATEA
ncbi:MAG: xanthine dehydrogenase YagS FAD-binding subunit [Planctomycetota bacterium]|jgi:xanthine dehydrogenase YagS FAD-binding subunit